MNKKLRDIFQDKSNYLLALVSALSVYLYLNLDLMKEETAFDRSFHALGLLGYSINDRVFEFQKFYFVYFPILFVFLLLFLGFTLYGHTKTKMMLQNFSAFYICVLPLFFITKYSNGSSIARNTHMPLIFFALILVIALCSRLFEHVLQEMDYFVVTLLTFSEWFCLLSLFHVSGLFPFVRKLRLVIFVVFWFIQIACVYFNRKKNKDIFLIEFAKYMVWLPFILCLSLEGMYVCIGRGVRINHSYAVVCIVGIAWIALALFLSCIRKNNKEQISLSSYVGFLCSLGAMNGFPGFSSRLDYYLPEHLFEMGNTTGFVDTIISKDWLGANYFSAHMLSDSLSRMIYYLFNKDLYGAINDNYGRIGEIVIILVSFYLLKSVLSEKYAFLICCMLPIWTTNTFAIDLCFLSVLAMISLYKNNKRINYFLYWFALLFGVFYQLDRGIGLGLGCILIVLCLTFAKKFSMNWKYYLQAFASASILSVLYFLVGCLKEGVSTVSRFKELVYAITKSNAVWAMDSTGNVLSLNYFIVYCFVPLVCICIFVYLLINIGKVSDKDINVYSVCISLCVAQFVFASRTMVLYTLANGVSVRFFSYFALLVALFLVYMCNQKTAVTKATLFCIGFLGTVFLQCSLVTGFETRIEKIPLVSAELASLQKDFQYKSDDGIERTTLHPELEKDVAVFQQIFEEVLDVDDTFIDFANVSGLYGLLCRERPFYISQSPGLLTNEESQRMYIEEIEKNGKAKAVIMPNGQGAFLEGMLGINHSQRYYLVAEYIYTHYKPLLQYNTYAIWIRNDQYLEAREKFKNSTMLLEDVLYGDIDILHNYNYGLYSWEWANLDTKNAINQDILYSCQSLNLIDTVYFIDNDQIIKDTGNYLKFTLDCNSSSQATVHFTDDHMNAVADYQITLRPGRNDYLLRCSNDYSWYALSSSYVWFEIDEECWVDDVQILLGE